MTWVGALNFQEKENQTSSQNLFRNKKRIKNIQIYARMGKQSKNTTRKKNSVVRHVLSNFNLIASFLKTAKIFLCCNLSYFLLFSSTYFSHIFLLFRLGIKTLRWKWKQSLMPLKPFVLFSSDFINKRSRKSIFRRVGAETTNNN